VSWYRLADALWGARHCGTRASVLALLQASARPAGGQPWLRKAQSNGVTPRSIPGLAAPAFPPLAITATRPLAPRRERAGSNGAKGDRGSEQRLLTGGNLVLLLGRPVPSR